WRSGAGHWRRSLPPPQDQLERPARRTRGCGIPVPRIRSLWIIGAFDNSPAKIACIEVVGSKKLRLEGGRGIFRCKNGQFALEFPRCRDKPTASEHSAP